MRSTALFLAVSALTVVAAQSALADDCPPPQPNSGPPVITTGAPTISGEYSWTVDRYPADVFAQINGDTLGRNGVIDLRLGPCGYYDRVNGGRSDVNVQQFQTFADLQGSKMSPGIVAGTAVVSTSLYLPAAWDEAKPFTTSQHDNYVGDFQLPMLLIDIADGNGEPAAYPAIRFLNRSNADDPPVVQIYDSLDTGNWITVPAALNFDGWNAIEVRFIKNDDDDYVIEYVVNGETVYTDNIQDKLDDASDPGLGLKEVMLEGLNNNSSPYDVYWADTYAANLRKPGDAVTGELTGDLVLVGNSSALDNADVEGNLVLVGDGAMTGGSGSFSGDGLVKDGAKLGGNIEIDGDLTNLSGIIAPGNSPGIITIGGNYTGSLAGPDDTIPSGVFEADLSAAAPVAGADYDQFNIGGTASGVTAITLADLSAPGSDLGDLGDMHLIRIGDTSVDPSGAFVQANRLVKNGEDIRLAYHQDTDPTYPGYYNLEASLAPETVTLAALPTLDQLAGEDLMGTYIDRRGLDWSAGKGVWGRVIGSRFNLDAGAVAGSGNFGGLQAGLDLFEPVDGLHLGLTGSFGAQSADIQNGGHAQTTNAAIGAYATYANPDGLYFDLLGQVRSISSTIDTSYTTGMKVDGHAVDLSAELGWGLKPAGTLVVVPFAQLMYEGISIGNYNDGTFAAHFGGGGLSGRAGVAVEGDLGGFRVRGTTTLISDLGGQTTTVSSTPVAVDGLGTRLEVGGGLDTPLGSDGTLHLGGYYRAALNGGDSQAGVSASLKFAF